MVQASFFQAISFSYRVRIFLFLFGGIQGFTISRQPNRTTIAFAGSNVTLTWNLILTPEEKTELLEVWFGTWNNNFQMVGIFLKKSTLANKLIMHATENTQKAKRWHWNGDISQTYAIAYQLTNAQHDDAGDYGIRVRADTWPPGIESKGPFSLAIREPPVTPAVVPPKITRKPLNTRSGIGANVTLTCQANGDPLPIITCTKEGATTNQLDNVSGLSFHLVMASLKDAGVYRCTAENGYGTVTEVATVSIICTSQCNTSTVGIRITEGAIWVDSLVNLNSAEFSELATILTVAVISRFLCISSPYSRPENEEKSPYETSVKEFRRGSVRARVEMEFPSTLSDPLKSLRDALQSRKLRMFTVDGQLVIINRILTFPGVDVHPRKQTVLEGGPTLMTCLAKGIPLPAISWTFGNGELPPDATIRNVPEQSILEYSKTSKRMEGWYTCRGNNEAGDALANSTLHVLANSKATVQWYFIVGPLLAVTVLAFIVLYLWKRRIAGTYTISNKYICILSTRSQ